MEDILFECDDNLFIEFKTPDEEITLDFIDAWSNIRNENIIDTNYYKDVIKILKSLPKVEYEVEIISYQWRK